MIILCENELLENKLVAPRIYLEYYTFQFFNLPTMRLLKAYMSIRSEGLFCQYKVKARINNNLGDILLVTILRN